MKRAHVEHDLQRAVVRLLRSGILHPDVFWTAINPLPGRTLMAGAQAKQLGVRAGVPDLLFVHKGFALWVELKAGRGRQSAAQLDTTARLLLALGWTTSVTYDDLGGTVILCRSTDDVTAALSVHSMLRVKRSRAT